MSFSTRYAFVVWAAVGTGGGCASNSGGGDGGGGGADLSVIGEQMDLSNPQLPSDLAGAQFFQPSIGPITLAPSQERTVCSTFRLSNTTPIDIVQIDASLAPGSHHVILYKSGATTEAKALVDCPPLAGVLGGGGDIPLYIAESVANNRMPLPSGVAYHFDAGQMIKLEAHYLNASPNTIMGMGIVNLLAGPPGGTYQAADIMFCGSVLELMSTGVPPGMTTLGPGFYKPPAGIKVFGLTTHEHKRGTLMTIDKSTSNAPGTNLTMGMPYDNPPFKIYDDSHLISFGPGEGLRWQCSYDNMDSQTYKFGESAQNNEMCFLWAYYYPSVGRFISAGDCWQ